MIVTSISVIEKGDGPESESWSQWWRDRQGRTDARYHLRGPDDAAVAVLEAGMQGGRTSVMVGLDLGDGNGLVIWETSARMFDTIASAVRGARDRFEGTDESVQEIAAAVGEGSHRVAYEALFELAKRHVTKIARESGVTLSGAATEQGAGLLLYRAFLAFAAQNSPYAGGPPKPPGKA